MATGLKKVLDNLKDACELHAIPLELIGGDGVNICNSTPRAGVPGRRAMGPDSSGCRVATAVCPGAQKELHHEPVLPASLPSVLVQPLPPLAGILLSAGSE